MPRFTAKMMPPFMAPVEARARSTLRTRRFRRQLYAANELEARAGELVPRIAAVHDLWRDGGSEVEVVAAYILEFLRAMRPKDYRGGPHGFSLCQTDASERSVWSENLKVVATHSLRSCPLAVNRSLVAWAEGRYPLKLFDHAPDAETILRFQSEGRRVVTCFFKPAELTSLTVGGRDPLGFAFHDLIHAEHFFRDAEMARAQVGFYQDLLKRFESGEFAAQLATDARFAGEFEYLIGDMNSHPEHLAQTLRAILSGAEERRKPSLLESSSRA